MLFVVARTILASIVTRPSAQSVAIAALVAVVACGRHAAVPAEAPPAPTQYAPPQRPAMQADLQLQFRFKALQSLTDIDPPRIEAAIRELDGVVRFEVFDDCASDATFVTLVIELSERDAAHLAALQRALLSIRNVQALAVDPSGRTTPVQGLAPDRIPDVARSHVKL